MIYCKNNKSRTPKWRQGFDKRKMNVDKKLLPAPKQSYNEDMFNEEDTVKLIHITTINVH